MRVDRHFFFFLFSKKYEKLFRLDKFCPRLAIYFVFIPFTMRLNDASTCISFSLCLSSRTNIYIYSIKTKFEFSDSRWKGRRIGVAVSGEGEKRVADELLVQSCRNRFDGACET